MPRQKLGDLLVEMGAISRVDLEDALHEARGGRLGDYLISQGKVTHQEVAQALAKQFGLEYLAVQDVSFQPAAVKALPEQLARRYHVVPLELDGKHLRVATADPLNVLMVDDLSFVTQLDIDLAVMTPSDIERGIERVYLRGEEVKVADKTDAPPTVANPNAADDSPIVRLVNSLINQAIEDGASDIHIEPQENSLRIRFRIDGMLQELNTLGKDVNFGLVTRIKILAGLDISERRLPQDGAIRYKHGNYHVDLRISTLPGVHGEKVVIRLFNPSKRLLTMTDIGLQNDHQAMFHEMLEYPYGLVIICGPTGSGKTTTLQVMLHAINDNQKNIITIEDPVEYKIPGVNHVQVNTKIDLTFANVLRSVLRQDPDIIMVGETRDQETAEIAVRSALTGHFVLTSLHTNDAPSSLTRLIDMGVEPFLVASSTVGIIAQRLVRRICPYCAEKVTYSKNSSEMIALGINEEMQAFKAVGCPRCHDTGYRGRMGIFEVMPITEEIREMVINRVSSSKLRQAALRAGMRSLKDDGILKIRLGFTTPEEVMRVTFQD